MKFPLFKVHIPVDESINNIREVLSSGYVNEGLQVKHFQQKLKDFLGIKNLILTNSCTSALTLALKISGVGPGTEVITTPMTCIATNTPIVNLGAKIVWADVYPENGSINPQEIEKKITNKTKAIVFVNYGGLPCDLTELTKLSKKHKLILIQDAAQSLGSTYKKKSITKYADFTIFSFQAIKHISSGDGGLLCIKDIKLKKKHLE